MNKQIQTHLSQDPVMKELINQYDLVELSGTADLYMSLLESIISQQLLVKAADTIFKRITSILGETVDPQILLDTPDETLRGAGASFSKIKYMKGIAEAKLKGELENEIFVHLSDEEVANTLIKLKGVGMWTAEMILIFTLKRPDVFSVGDLGLRTAIGKLYNVDRGDIEKILIISEQWKPYRSYAARYLWKSLDNTPR